jgi:hypothetical protein
VITHATPREGDGIQRMLETAEASKSSGNSAIDSTAFQNALTQALDQALASIGVTNSGVSVSPSTSASGQQQFVVTMGSANSSAASTAPAATATPVATTSTSTSSSSASSASTSGADWWAIESTPGWQAAEKAYWADQPAAVQQLENAPQSEKGSLAASLESQGYSIDVPIMVWGWDPILTNETLRAYGDPYNASLLQQAGV